MVLLIMVDYILTPSFFLITYINSPALPTPPEPEKYVSMFLDFVLVWISLFLLAQLEM